MIGKLLLWARRNSRKAVALSLAPTLVLLAVDADIAHFFGKESDNGLQWIPVVYGAVAFVLLVLCALPFIQRRAFIWSARLLGAAGVGVGLAGTVFHVIASMKALEGDYSWANLQGTLGDAPPVFAPLGFAGVGALLMILSSSRLLLRLKLGRPKADAKICEFARAKPTKVPEREERSGDEAAS